MGLSNQERYKKIAWAIHNIEQELKYLKDTYESSEIKKYSGKLWPAFLNESGNSAFWITGGSFDSDHLEGCDLISTAFEAHMEKLLNEKNKQKGEFVWESKEDYLERSIRMENLISGDGAARKIVIIWKHIEAFLYAVNRYHDEMSQSLTPIKNIISNMQGDLFTIFSRDDRYFKAYLMNRILEKCVNIYDDEDIIAKTIRDGNFHHHFHVDEYTDGASLMDMWTKIQFQSEQEIETNTKILYVVRCMGRRIADHKKRIFDVFKDHVDQSAFDNMFEKCIADKKEYDECNKTPAYSDHCDLTWRWKV